MRMHESHRFLASLITRTPTTNNVALVFGYIGSALLALMILCIVAVPITYSGAKDRSNAAAITPVEYGQDPIAAIYREPSNFNGKSTQVDFIRQISLESAAPIGLSSWPRPGQIAVSPAIAEDPALLESAKSRYGGDYVVLDSASLPFVNERVVYVFLEPDLKTDESFTMVSSFSGNYLGWFSLWNVQPQWMLVALILGFGLLPAMLLVQTSFRYRNAPILQGIYSAQALGVNKEWLRMVILKRHVGTVAIGTTIGLVGFLSWSLSSSRVPFTDFRMHPRDITEHWFVYVAASVLCAAVTMGIIAFDVIPRRVTSRVFKPSQEANLSKNAILLFAVVALSLVPFMRWAATQGLQGLATAIYVGAAITLFLVFPSAISTLVGRIAELTAYLGNAFGRPALLVSGRFIQSSRKF